LTFPISSMMPGSRPITLQHGQASKRVSSQISQWRHRRVPSHTGGGRWFGPTICEYRKLTRGRDPLPNFLSIAYCGGRG
jgi:hypothetical protein